MKHLTIIVLLIGFVSCKPARLSERTIIRDTTIYVRIPGDTIHDTVVAKEGAFSILTTGYGNSIAWINSGKLFHRLEQQEKYLPATLKQVEKTTTITPPKTPATPGSGKQGLTTLQKIQVFLGNVFLIVVAGLVAMRFIHQKGRPTICR